MNDPKPGVPDERYFNLIASDNLSIRKHPHFRGGFTDFAQLNFATTIRELGQKYDIHWLSTSEQELLQQRYQIELAELAPNSWAKHPKFMAAAVIDRPLTSLILFVEVAHKDKPSSLAMLRIQNSFEFYSPPVMVSGYLETRTKEDGITAQVDRQTNTSSKEHSALEKQAEPYVIATTQESNSDFAQYDYFLEAPRLCSFHEHDRLGIDEMSLRIKSSFRSQQPNQDLARFLIKAVTTDDLPCWLTAQGGSNKAKVARRFISLRREQLHTDGVLLSLSLGYSEKAYPSQTDQRPKIIYIWCHQFTQCETAYVKARGKNANIIYDDAAIATQASLFLASDASSQPYLQQIRFQKIASGTEKKNEACWKPVVEKSLRLSSRGVEDMGASLDYLPRQKWMDYRNSSKIEVINIAPAHLLAGLIPNPLCEYQLK